MGEVDLHFRPAVPVFDANVALGRRHDRRVTADTVDAVQSEMRRAGIDRALVYSAHSAAFDTQDGNDYLLEMLEGASDLVPQLACSPAGDDLDRFAAQVGELGVRSVRMFPKTGGYPFRSWVVGPWLEWLAAEGLPLWLPAPEFDPGELHDTLARPPRSSGRPQRGALYTRTLDISAAQEPPERACRDLAVRRPRRPDRVDRRGGVRARAVRVQVSGLVDGPATVQPTSLRLGRACTRGRLRRQSRPLAVSRVKLGYSSY